MTGRDKDQSHQTAPPTKTAPPTPTPTPTPTAPAAAAEARAARPADVLAADERARLILESITDAFFALGRDWRFTYVNAEAERVLRRPRGELLGRDVWQEFPAAAGTSFEREYRRAMADGTTVRFVEFYPWPLDRWYEVRAYPSPDGLSVYFQDVTDRRQAEDALRASERRFRQLADAMPQIVWAAKPDGTLDYYNRRWFEYVDLPADDGEAAAWDRHIHPDDLPRVYAAWAASVGSGRPYTAEFRVRRADGAYRWFLVRALPVAAAAGGDADDAGHRDVSRGGGKGGIARWYGTCTDVDDQRALRAEKEHLLDRERAARAEAETANRAKDRHLAFLAHELRGPLTPALLAAAAITGDATLPPGVRADAAVIRRNIELTTRLADDLLDANRIAHGKLELRAEPTDAHDTVRAAVVMCAADAAARDVRVDLELRAERCEVTGDAAKLTQVWCNLLKNAVKFSRPGGRVTVRSSDADRSSDAGLSVGAGGGRLRVEVADAGEGVDADLLPRMFDLYEQGDRSVTRQHAGLGLGLSICKGIVDAHGGTIAAASPGRGLGTTMTVELPAARPAAAAPVAGQPPPAAAAGAGVGGGGAAAGGRRSGAGLNILLVDDHEDTLRMMSRLLGVLDHRVTTATGVGPALSAAAAAEFDLLISDVGLGDGSGTDLMRELLKRRPLKGIALTGYGTAADVAATRAAGFAAHLTKPVNFDQLQAMIEKVTS